MSSDLNRSILIGRLTRDPEIRYTPSGTAVANFTLANNKTFTSGGEKKDHVSYIDCIAWSKLGEVITEYCKKGHRIAVEGRLQQSRWDDQDGKKRSKLEVVVENFQFLNNKDNNENNESSEKKPASPAATPPDESNSGIGEDMGNREDMFNKAYPCYDEDLENLF